jgi:hypothetical protein
MNRLTFSLTLAFSIGLCSCQSVPTSGLAGRIKDGAISQGTDSGGDGDSMSEVDSEICTDLSCLSPLVSSEERLNTEPSAPEILAEKRSLLATMGIIKPASDRDLSKLYPVALAIHEVDKTSQNASLGPQGREVLKDFLSQAQNFLSIANDQFAEGQTGTGDAYLHVAAFMTQSATKMLDPSFRRTVISSVGPGAMVRDFYEASTGKSIIDGAKLSRVDRSVALLSVATGGVAATLFKQAQTVDKIAGVGNMLRNSAEKSGDSSEDLNRVIQTADEIFAKVDTVRSRVSEERESRLKDFSSYMTSDSIKERLERIEQNATKFIGR